MHTALALSAFSFGSRPPPANPFARLRLALHRWRVHARFEAIAASLSDVKFNPFLFQIESSR